MKELKQEKQAKKEHKKKHRHHGEHKQHKKDRKYHKRRYSSEESNSKPSNPPQQPNQIVKQLPCFEPSGILLEYYNSRQGVKLKFHEPPESRQPVDDWRIYPFKGQNNFNPIFLKNSCYLVGKDERICDILCENPSISRQHAVIQFRQIHKPNIDGTYDELILPYVMDLESTNGTFLNEEKIQPSRYVQILDRDILKFGLSDRLYVFVRASEQS